MIFKRSMSFIMVKYFHLSEHSSHSFQPLFKGKSVINDVLDPTYFRCGYFILWLILCQGFSTVTSVTGHSNHQITRTWITCNHQSALPQIHASHRHSSYGLPFPDQFPDPVCTYPFQTPDHLLAILNEVIPLFPLSSDPAMTISHQ